MIAFAELIYGNNVTMTTPTRTLFSVSYAETNQSIIIKEDSIIYSAPILDIGYVIQDEAVLTYGIYS